LLIQILHSDLALHKKGSLINVKLGLHTAEACGQRITQRSLFVLDVPANLWINTVTQVPSKDMRFLHYITILILLASPGAFAGQPAYENAFSPKQGATELIISTINKAHKTIKMAAYTFTSIPIANALIQAKHHGVEVEIVLDRRQSNGRGNLFNYLIENGVLVKRNGNYAIMHNKFIIIDNKVLELGSFNYTKAAEKRNAENVLVIRRAPKIIKEYTEQWDKLWQEAE
jgi:phosphatidylserine/phosphatidylglycerophosphate/cardiolipin synthase-like enzyme